MLSDNENVMNVFSGKCLSTKFQQPDLKLILVRCDHPQSISIILLPIFWVDFFQLRAEAHSLQSTLRIYFVSCLIDKNKNTIRMLGVRAHLSIKSQIISGILNFTVGWNCRSQSLAFFFIDLHRFLLIFSNTSQTPIFF